MIPHLEDETNLEEAEKRLAEFGSNTKLGQNSALDLLDELGLAEGTRNRDQGLPKDAKEQGGPPEDETPTSEGKTPFDPGEEASRQSIPTTTTARRSQPRGICPILFDWSSLRTHQLVATEDIMQKKYLTTLALHETEVQRLNERKWYRVRGTSQTHQALVPQRRLFGICSISRT